MKSIIRKSFIKSIPIMCSYVFVSMAYGITMAEAGFGWGYSLFTSLTVYTGAFQFLLASFLSAGAGITTIFITALLMNSRQIFYSIAMLKDFKGMGKLKPYMIHTMTDETFAVNITLTETGTEKQKIMFWVACLSRVYWMVGAVIGGMLGQVIQVSLKGIDFCMTALFITILIDQWEKNQDHRPALIGIAVGVICLFVFQANIFILPALILSSGILIFWERWEDGK